MVSKSLLASFGALFFASAHAHMEMTWPYPFKSKWNPANPRAGDAIDWSMTNPLGVYPCKGHIDPSAPAVATWSAGSSVNYTVAGSAIHGGGSCQISMSYDQGKTWNVIYSIIGGCLVEGLTQDVTIPSDAPSGDALFAWSWFNLVGNREMYQNCAPVKIINGGSGLDSASYPAPFVANVDAAPNCKTVEWTEVVFPNPGKNVKYGGKYKGITPKAGAGITGDCGTVSTPPTNTGNGNTGNGNTESQSSTVPNAVETLFVPSSISVSASSTASIANTIPSGNANQAASPIPSTSTLSASASSPTGTGAKKCKRRSARGIEKRHERLVRHSAHQHLVRRKLSHH